MSPCQVETFKVYFFKTEKKLSMLLSLAAMTAEMKEEWLGLNKNVYLMCSSLIRRKLLQLILQIKQDSESIFLHWSHWGSQCEKWNVPSGMARGQHSTNQTQDQGTGRWRQALLGQSAARYGPCDLEPKRPGPTAKVPAKWHSILLYLTMHNSMDFYLLHELILQLGDTSPFLAWS